MSSFAGLRLVKLSWHHTYLLMGWILHQIAFLLIFLRFLEEVMQGIYIFF